MNAFILLVSVCTSFFLMSFDVSNLDSVRINYRKSLSDKAVCKNMIGLLGREKNPSATHLAYLGGLQTIWAQHVFSPISKLSTFNKGKDNIEKAIKMEPADIELRFIRLSVQKNAPSFLGYNSNIIEDREFIKNNYDKVDIIILRQNIDHLLKD